MYITEYLKMLCFNDKHNKHFSNYYCNPTGNGYTYACIYKCFNAQYKNKMCMCLFIKWHANVYAQNKCT